MSTQPRPSRVLTWKIEAGERGAAHEVELELPDDHILGIYDQGEPGPLFFVTGGIHGNEGAGVVAAEETLQELLELQPRMRGRLVAVAGNVGALDCGERYSVTDLNRLWKEPAIRAARSKDVGERNGEEREMCELLALFEDEYEAWWGRGKRLVCLDLHTSSAEGAPFSCMGDTLRNRVISFALPIPTILGLEETLDGAMLDMFYERGAIAVAVEGGRHHEASAIENLKASIWISLIAAGCLDESDVPRLDEYQERLRRASDGIPRVLEVRHREIVGEHDHFEMLDGYASFDFVTAGQALASKNEQEIHAKEAGYVLLPLYQGMGSDGFFLGRAVSPFWLSVSRRFRQLGFDDLLCYLPGVRRHPELRDAFRVNSHVARWFATEIFHLLGYRRRRPEGEWLVFTRRPERVS